MQRRDFVALLGGAAASWPLAARAQQAVRTRRIGMLMFSAADDPESPARVAAFAQGLQEFGWTIGRDVRIDYRWGASNEESARPVAAELVALMPDILVATTGSTVRALQQVTRTVPIVFPAASDPVAFGAGLRRTQGGAQRRQLQAWPLHRRDDCLSSVVEGADSRGEGIG